MTKMGSCQNLANTGIHTIQKASFSDAGTYVCKLISDGEVKTKFVTVNVTGKSSKWSIFILIGTKTADHRSFVSRHHC